LATSLLDDDNADEADRNVSLPSCNALAQQQKVFQATKIA